MSAKIHFYIRTERPTKEGSVQIIMSFSLSSKQRQKISTGKFISLKKEYRKLSLDEISNIDVKEREQLYNWDWERERATKGNENWESINAYLDGEKFRANEILFKHNLMNKVVTLYSFSTDFLKPQGIHNFEEYFTNELDTKRKHLLAAGTLKGFKAQISKICKFKPNLSLANIDYKFLNEYENYMLKPVKDGGLGNIPNTVSKSLKMLRTLILIAIKNGDFLKEAYPFKDYKIKHIDPVLTSRDYLEPDELLKVEQLLSPENIESLTLGERKAVKRFLFACYTGLRFSDVNNLNRKQHIFGKYVLNPETNEMIYRVYIELMMEKTGRPVFIPLIDKAVELLNETESEFVFEKISNQKVNEHLKNINKKASLNKKLSFHVARHSFATICFLYGIPEQVGQKLLGHKNRKFMEVYTHLSQNKLFYEMDKLNRGLSQFQIMVEDADEQKSNIKEMLPLLQNMSIEKLDQLKGLIRLLGS